MLLFLQQYVIPSAFGKGCADCSFQLFTLGLNVAVILANARYYWDRHIWDIPLDKIHPVGKIAMAAKSLFVCAAFFTRLSLLCFYYRLTVDTGLAKYRWTLHGAMIFNLCIFLTFLPQSIFLCRQVNLFMLPSIT